MVVPGCEDEVVLEVKSPKQMTLPACARITFDNLVCILTFLLKNTFVHLIKSDTKAFKRVDQSYETVENISAVIHSGTGSWCHLRSLL